MSIPVNELLKKAATDDEAAFRVASTILGNYEVRTWKVLPAGGHKVTIVVEGDLEVTVRHMDRLTATRRAIVTAATNVINCELP